MAEVAEKKLVKSYVDESMYDQLKLISHVLDISMSKCIAECVVFGLELMVAEVLRKDPKILSPTIKKYLEENNINFKFDEKNNIIPKFN
ncbi:MAG: hypothetical protein FWC41_12765 [Firmicutes bacterium]|nr:hypothetical protein [Bacillota bacterium]